MNRSKLLENLKETITHELILEEQNKDAGISIKSYAPKGKTYSKISKENTEVLHLFKEFSPCINGELYNKNIHEEFFKIFFPFKWKQINEMREEVKKKIIVEGLKGLKSTLRIGKSEFLPKNQMFEDVYEVERLKYMIQYGQEPSVVYSMEDYYFLEEKFLEMMEIALNYYLRVERFEGQKKDVVGLSYQTSIDLINQFKMQLLKRFDVGSIFTLQALKDVVDKKIINNELNQRDVLDYKEYKVCLITKDLLVCFDSYVDNILTNGAVPRLYFICKHGVVMKELINEENMTKIISCLNKVANTLLLFLESEKKDILVRKKFGERNRKEVVELMKIIPNFIETIQS